MVKEPKAGVEDRWKAYIEDEGRRRLGWGIFVSTFDPVRLYIQSCALMESAARRADGCSTWTSMYDVNQRSLGTSAGNG